MRWLWSKIKSFCAWIWQQLRDWRNLIIFVITFIILSCEVWVSYIVYFCTGNTWWLGIGSACWAFWLGPFTPFVPLCVAITLGIRKIIDKIHGRRKNDT